jgi:hypothetical protein
MVDGAPHVQVNAAGTHVGEHGAGFEFLPCFDVSLDGGRIRTSHPRLITPFDKGGQRLFRQHHDSIVVEF